MKSAVLEPGVSWWSVAACVGLWDLFQAERQAGRVSRSRELDPVTVAHGRAVHICLSHCPVLAQCTAEIERVGAPIGQVQAGVLWADTSTHKPTPAAFQPAPRGCGSHCAHLRNVEVPGA